MYNNLYVSLFHGPELSCEYSLGFLLNKLGNNDRIAGVDKICPTLMGKNYIHQIVGWNILN